MSESTVRRLLTFAVGFDLISLALGLLGFSMALWTFFLPWMQPGIFYVPVLIVGGVLTAAVAYWRSRLAAIGLLAFYVLARLVTFGWLTYAHRTVDTVTVALWFAVSVVWAAGLLVGVVATIAYHRLPAGVRTPQPLRESLGVGAALLVALALVAVPVLTTLFPQGEPGAPTGPDITFTARSSGPAAVRYFTKTTGDWSTTVRAAEPADRYELTVTFTGAGSGTVFCRIDVAGKPVSEQEATAVGATVTFSGESG